MDIITHILSRLWDFLAQQSPAIQALEGIIALAGTVWGIVAWRRRRAEAQRNQPNIVLGVGGDAVLRDKIVSGGDVVYGNKISPPAVAALSPTPAAELELVIGYTFIKKDPAEHIYQLQVSINNGGSKPASRYGFDLWIPADILVSYASDTTALVSSYRDGEYIVLRFRNDRTILKDSVILPGDAVEILPSPTVLGGIVNYGMTDQLRRKYINWPLKFRLFSEGNPTDGEVPFDKWQVF